jgi:hypothetical protein
LLIVNWLQCPHCSRFPQSNLLNKNLKIIIKKFIEAILEFYKKMHFFYQRRVITVSLLLFYLSEVRFEIKKEQAIDEVKREKELGVFKI